jgi:hypothetical protein
LEEEHPEWILLVLEADPAAVLLFNYIYGWAQGKIVNL